MSLLFSYAAYAAIPAAVAGIFLSAFANDLCSRIISYLIDSLLFVGKQGLRSRSNCRAQMFAARALRIAYSNNRANWRWVPQTGSRFMEAAELLNVLSLEITARIQIHELSPETNYTAHLIFKTTTNSRGLDTFQEASVSAGRFKMKTAVCVKPRVSRSRNKCIKLPTQRSDDWMELELGRFCCDSSISVQEVEVSLTETDDQNEKRGLIVAGIELRPF